VGVPRAAQIGLVVVSGVFLRDTSCSGRPTQVHIGRGARPARVLASESSLTPLGKRLLGERVSRQMLAGVGLAIVGMIVTAPADFRVDSSAFGGDLLAIAGGLCLAGYLLIAAACRSNLGVAGLLGDRYAVVSVIAALTLLPQASRTSSTTLSPFACLDSQSLHDRPHRVHGRFATCRSCSCPFHSSASRHSPPCLPCSSLRPSVCRT